MNLSRVSGFELGMKTETRINMKYDSTVTMKHINLIHLLLKETSGTVEVLNSFHGRKI